MVASTRITPGWVQFLQNKKRFHTAWTRTGLHAALFVQKSRFFAQAVLP
jgi:hypothetical protein